MINGEQILALKPTLTALMAGILCAAALFGQAPREEPVGLVLSAGGAQLLRTGVETPLSAKTGEILFSGDALIAGEGPATFLFCPEKASYSLTPANRAVLESAQVKAGSGALTNKRAVASCFLPKMARVATASQQHYGVSMTRGLGDDDPETTDPVDYPAELANELALHNGALSANSNDPVALTARAVLFEDAGLKADALEEYKKLGSAMNEAVWVRGKIFELQEELAAEELGRRAEEFSTGKTTALLIGISEYQKLPKENWLQYADDDAETFEKFLRSPRGGGLPAEDIMVLTNEQATTAAIRNAFQSFLKGAAGKNNTVFILLAGHAIVENPGRRRAYIVSHDSDLQDLETTAVSLDDIRQMVDENLKDVGRLILYTDVCRAGQLGSLRSNTVNSSVEQLGDAEGDLFGFMASRPREVSFEGPEFGGGHGAFSYYVLKALNGEGDRDGDNVVSFNELIDYVRSAVPRNTRNKQHPRDFGTLDTSLPASDISEPGIELVRYPVLYDFRHGEPAYVASAQAPQATSPGEEEVAQFSRAIESGRLLPTEPGNAFGALAALKPIASPEVYFAQENRLRIALEDLGQQALLKYLEGDENPQTRDDFSIAANHITAARDLTPESLYLDGRESFLSGRAMLFDKKFPEAAELLERSVRIDPGGAYAYNALGISYLEQAEFSKAIPAFRDASRLAVHWVYPLHNLALAYVETGQYSEAINAYKKAMELKPSYSYLPYNLGLVYQRLNRRKDAENSYRQSIGLSPNSPEPYNALGALYAGRGRVAEAGRMYRTALEKKPGMLAARHNLAVLLADQPQKFDEAVQLWRANLAAAPDYLASRLGLAEGLAKQGRTNDAIGEYRETIRLKPDYPGARLALASLLAESGQGDQALEQLRTLLQADPNSTDAYERIGDIESAAGRSAEARAAYQSAIERTADRKSQKRLKSKQKKNRAT